jgi:MoxR-like ATPase
MADTLTLTAEFTLALGALAETRRALAARFVERDTEIDLLLLALVARTNLTLVGEPGVAKTALVRALGRAIDGARYFEAQLSPDTPAQAVLGPYSLPDLDRGVFRVNPAGMLPEAHVGLLDEGYRANAVLLDNLLALANPVERRFHNGPEVIDAPLWTLVITCNQLSDPGDERTEAFRDRMTLTRVVAPVRSEAARAAILRGQLARRATPAPGLPLVSREEMEAAQAAAGAVACEDDFLADALRLWRAAEEAELPVSARRFGEILRLAQARAALDGRTACRTDDLTVAEHALWVDPEDAPRAAEVALGFASRARRRAAELEAALAELVDEAAGLLPAWEAVPVGDPLPDGAVDRGAGLIRRAGALGAKAQAEAERGEGAEEALGRVREGAGALSARVQRAIFGAAS